LRNAPLYPQSGRLYAEGKTVPGAVDHECVPLHGAIYPQRIMRQLGTDEEVKHP
jgi:hypothetical protein